MSAPRMCDVCKKVEPTPNIATGPPNVAIRQMDQYVIYPALPIGWQYIALSSGTMSHNAEVCSQACAVNFIDRHWNP